MSDSSEPREPPNERLSERAEYLREITESTVTVEYHGGSVYRLTARDNQFWNSVFRTLREHDFQIQKLLDGTLYVEKKPHDETRERREPLSTQCINCGSFDLDPVDSISYPPGVDEEECQECGTIHDPPGIR